MPPENPYKVGNPVGTTPTFVGRNDILKSVTRVLSNPSQSGLLLHGQRRIGKTSLLQHLDNRLHSIKSSPYLTVIFDLQDKAKEPLELVLNNLSEEIAHSIGFDVPDLGKDPLKSFRDQWLPAVLSKVSKDKTLTLLFDEFDALTDTKSEQASEAFFPYFRELLSQNPSNLKFIFVLGRNISDISTNALSFVKGMEVKKVSLLSQSDTTKLIRLSETLNNSLNWTEETTDLVWNLTNGHPYLTQALCSQVWFSLHENNRRATPTATLTDVKDAVEPILESSGGMLEWLWGGLGPAERVAAAALAEAGPITVTSTHLERLLHENGVKVILPAIKNAPELLQEWDLLEPTQGGYKFRVELLRQWIQKYKKVSRIRQELNRLEPDADDYYQIASRLYYEDHAADNALNILRKAIDKNAYHTEANSLCIEILTNLGNFDEADKYIDQLEMFDPKNARLLKINNLLSRESRAIDFYLSLELCNKILILDPNQTDIIKKRADIIERQLNTFYKNKQENRLRDFISDGLLNTDESNRAEDLLRTLESERYQKEIETINKLKDADRVEEAIQRTNELARDYSQDSIVKQELLRKKARSKKAMHLFLSIMTNMIYRTVCLIASGLLWAPVYWINLAIRNNTILIGKTLNFSTFYTQSTWTIIFLWVVSSLFISAKKGFRLEPAWGLGIVVSAAFAVPGIMLWGLIGVPNIDSWYYFLLVILVPIAIICGYICIREISDDNDDGLRLISILFAIVLNIAIVVLCL